MSLQILYFAGLKEALGVAGEQIELPSMPCTLGDLRDHLAQQPGRAALNGVKNLRCALNQEMVRFDALLKDGDEVAFFPPVTGG